MPYDGERASKLGHLLFTHSPWISDLVNGFERAPPAAGDPSGTPWRSFDPAAAFPLSRVWAVDGSFVEVRTQDKPPREVAFVKTALLFLDRDQVAESTRTSHTRSTCGT